MALRVCPSPGCPNLTAGGACPTCQATRQAARDKRNAGYRKAGHRDRFRPAVLAMNGGRCVLCDAPATVADHHPRTRRELVDLGLDADDPRHGRPICKPCHDRHTARTSPGGWNDRYSA